MDTVNNKRIREFREGLDRYIDSQNMPISVTVMALENTLEKAKKVEEAVIKMEEKAEKGERKNGEQNKA